MNRNKYDRYYQADFGQAENNLKDEFAELKKQRIHLGANGTEEIKMRMPMYLTSVFEELYPDAIPFSLMDSLRKEITLVVKVVHIIAL